MPDEQAVDFASWPEQPAPPGVNCEMFGLVGHTRFVWAEGNPDGQVMVVLDNPGARETPAGDPFVCGTRLTLRRAAVEAGLDPADMYLTFLVKCRPRRAYDREFARSIGREIVMKQLREARPHVLVLLGDVVTKAITGEEETSVRVRRGTAFRAEGIPTVVGYHPLAARRRPSLYPTLVEDLRLARNILAGAGGVVN